MAIDFSIELIKDPNSLNGLTDRLCATAAIAVDIETVDWWNRRRERVALVQIAYRTGEKTKIAVIDALASFDLEPLRRPLELESITKIMHNAAFDAARLAEHFKFRVATIHDTMAAARRNGERKYSLKAQAETHLGIYLNKGAQRSDWSRRPLDAEQLRYAALDAYSTFLLYENQMRRRLNGSFQLRSAREAAAAAAAAAAAEASLLQANLPLGDAVEPVTFPGKSHIKSIAAAGELSTGEEKGKKTVRSEDFSPSEIALLGVVAELPTRYHPDGLAASVESEHRVGLAGWIVDKILGADAELDEESVKLAIADLCERKLIRITATRRLEATTDGEILWNQAKSRGY